MNKLRLVVSAVMVIVLLLTAAPVLAGSAPFPKIIALPNGFQPEGIASGKGTDFYAGSLANGAIYKGNLRTGAGSLLVTGQPGSVAVGMAFDERSGYLFVAGGPTGSAKVYDTRTGAQVGLYQLTGPGSFINDVIVTRQAAYFTNSFTAVLYKLPLSSNGRLPDPSQVESLALSGDWVQVAGFNANGIEATPDGKALILVNSSAGNLYRVDPLTGVAVLIDLGGESVSAGDGLLLAGHTLYVMRNNLNLIAVVDLAPDLLSGLVTGGISDPAFRVPTTLLGFGNSIYAVNARFGTPPGPNVDYDIVQVSR